MSRKVKYRPMAPLEIRACKALANCTFLPATPQKRFARDMGAVAVSDNPLISDGQARWLWQLVYRYRRQIASERLQNLALAQNLWNDKRRPRALAILCPECGSDGVMSDTPKRGVCNICGHAWDNRTEEESDAQERAPLFDARSKSL